MATITLEPGKTTTLAITLVPKAPALASLEGTVKNSATGAAISVAGIDIVGPSPSLQVLRTGTNASGYFLFSNLVAGNYAGAVYAEGYEITTF